ncbi:MAG: hypothetical protein OXC82_07615 [Rhodobacteraceae bacterium]|nr:hypothetical protein [Paracoccaceae bacterium]MCY4250285.1 hypothetical protein [Paracoccaceae bacterium]MCY4309579.1 hypothetical protein [Paracoccaceae bacterium]
MGDCLNVFVHFILGVNLKALEGMVSARYGADIDASEYLQKFIQIKLELPEETDEANPENRKDDLRHLLMAYKVFPF